MLHRFWKSLPLLWAVAGTTLLMPERQPLAQGLAHSRGIQEIVSVPLFQLRFSFLGMGAEPVSLCHDIRRDACFLVTSLSVTVAFGKEMILSLTKLR